jgi:hypothetical protein
VKVEEGGREGKGLEERREKSKSFWETREIAKEEGKFGSMGRVLFDPFC